MNQIAIKNNSGKSLSDKSIEKIVEFVLSRFDIKNVLLEILFVDEKEISRLNQEHRKISQPTDVLSFPQLIVPEAKVRVLGSIVISEEMVSIKEEDLVDVIKHGLLHLLGYDHENNCNDWDLAAIKINCQL